LEIYQQLWAEAVAAFERGAPRIDPNLSDPANDLRRGVTLAFRPSAVVRTNVENFLDQLAGIAPGQYLYRPEELHVTVLSIISGTEFWRKEIRTLAACRPIIAEVLSRQNSFRVSFRGVTASPSAVMIQGFPLANGLEKMREELRAAFARNGFGGQLDRRYKINSAHMTVMRFQRTDADWTKLANFLAVNRETDFGEMEVSRIQLIWGDWYASANVARTLQEYRLSEAGMFNRSVTIPATNTRSSTGLC
jgi:2'-5' RNA ligase